MSSRLSRRVALATAAVLLISVVSAPVASAVAANDFSATCSFSSNNDTVDANFTPDGRESRYYWVWRTGYSVVAYGWDRYADTDSAIAVPQMDSYVDLTTGSVVRFGVVKGWSTKYSYVTCDDSDS